MLGTLQITGGTPGAGKVLTSDANGNATWQDASSGGGADTTLRNLFLPPAPTGLSASPGNTQVSLSWTAPTVPFSQVPLTNYSYQVSSNGGSSWGRQF
ncbi:MAG: fibronectin type III domain-containing protein [Proteobacteria bacterium]|nr:fibronectin type III domain-containing protein [Pseudomonadota bacterium]